MIKIIITSLIAILLSSCTSSHYGYDQATWDGMSPEEKENTINDVSALIKYGNDADRQNAETQSIIDRAGTYNN